MPYEHKIDSERGLISVRMWGVVTRAEVMAARAKIAGDSAFKPELSELIDVRDVQSANVTGADIPAIASSNIDPSARRAFVTSNIAIYGLARMFQAYHTMFHGGEQVAVFKTIAAAETWLDVAR